MKKLAEVFNLSFDELKTEFFSDLFAKQIMKVIVRQTRLSVAEEKVKCLKQINVKQEKLNLK